jgi:hypothetical protein
MEVCTHEHLPDRCSPDSRLPAPVSQMVHEVLHHEHLTHRCSSLRLLQPVMSADGSWSVCTHEHLLHR